MSKPILFGLTVNRKIYGLAGGMPVGYRVKMLKGGRKYFMGVRLGGAFWS